MCVRARVVCERMCASMHTRHTMTSIAAVQLLHCVQLFGIPRTAACQDSQSFNISRSLRKLMSTESVMPSNHLIFSSCPPSFPAPLISIANTKRSHSTVKVTRPHSATFSDTTFPMLSTFLYFSKCLEFSSFPPFLSTSMCQRPHLGPRWVTTLTRTSILPLTNSGLTGIVLWKSVVMIPFMKFNNKARVGHRFAQTSQIR